MVLGDMDVCRDNTVARWVDFHPPFFKFLYQNPSGTWTIGSTLESEGVTSLRSSACPEDKNIWQFYHPDLKSFQPVLSFTVKCLATLEFKRTF
jgi:hypothetical protein